MANEKIKHVGKGRLSNWLSRLEGVARTATMETSRFGFPAGMPGTTPLPVTEKDVDDFIRERTRVWRQSWIFPDLMGVVQEIREALGRQPADPIKLPVRTHPSEDDQRAACVACRTSLESAGKLIPTDRGLACLDCLVRNFENAPRLDASLEADSVEWFNDDSNCIVYVVKDTQGAESDEEADKNAHLFSFARRFYDALRAVSDRAEEELNDIAADIQEGGNPDQLSKAPWGAVLSVLSAFEGSEPPFQTAAALIPQINSFLPGIDYLTRDTLAAAMRRAGIRFRDEDLAEALREMIAGGDVDEDGDFVRSALAVRLAEARKSTIPTS